MEVSEAQRGFEGLEPERLQGAVAPGGLEPLLHPGDGLLVAVVGEEDPGQRIVERHVLIHHQPGDIPMVQFLLGQLVDPAAEECETVRAPPS